jgi:hypothetical protein
METLKFSMKTDVWAFGVVLLEICEDGAVPLHALTNQQVLIKIQSGYKAPKPPKCPESLYKVMCKCWALNPTDRPSFEALVHIFSESEFEQSAGSTQNIAAWGPNRARSSMTSGSSAVVDAAYIAKGTAAARTELQANQGMYFAKDANVVPPSAADRQSLLQKAHTLHSSVFMDSVHDEMISSGYVAKGTAAEQDAKRNNVGLYTIPADDGESLPTTGTTVAAKATETVVGGYVVKGNAAEQERNRANVSAYAVNPAAASVVDATCISTAVETKARGAYIEVTEGARAGKDGPGGGGGDDDGGGAAYLSLFQSNTRNEETSFGFGNTN